MSRRSSILALVVAATFTDIVAYSVAVPVLPDLSRRLGASPTLVGLLFASFGATLLAVSIPMGALSDRLGRRGPLVGGLVGLAAATLLFAFADSLGWLFVARLAQGAADAVTWVVGLALLADVYEPSERGRAVGIVMAGSSVAFMIGPTLGGWLYEAGGIRLPFVMVAILAMFAAVAGLTLKLADRREMPGSVPVFAVFGVAPVMVCAGAVVAASATICMLEPVLALRLAGLGVNPGRVGAVFGAAAIVSAIVHPIAGRLADRWGARSLVLGGLVLSSLVLPLVGLAWNFASATAFYALQVAAMSLVIAPSLAYMADATSSAGIESFGAAYGLYNVAWGIGLLVGPALGGFLFERIGMANLTLWWAPAVVLVALLLTRAAPPVLKSESAGLDVRRADS